MTALTDYAENAALDHLLGTTAWTKPVSTWLKLHIGDPGEAGTANPAAETTRKAMSWAAAAAGSITTDAAIQWTNLAATETITHFSIMDAETGGNPLAYGPLSEARAMNAGDTLDVAAGAVTLSFPVTFLTTYAANALLEHLTGRTAWTMPAGSFAVLHTGDPGSDGTANPATETTRVAITWAAASGGSASNSAAVQWSGLAASETITFVSVRDAAAAGNALLHRVLTSPTSVTAGQDGSFAVGALAAALL